MADREPGQSPLEALRAHYRAFAADPGIDSPEELVALLRVITSSPTLTAGMQRRYDQQREEFARTLATEPGAPDDDLTPHLVAGLISATILTLKSTYFRRLAAGVPPPRRPGGWAPTWSWPSTCWSTASATGPSTRRVPLHGKGINYDTGTFPGGRSSRETFDPAVVRRELRIIADDLHCNAVRGRRSTGARSTSSASTPTAPPTTRRPTARELRRHFEHGKPVVATEFGCCTYRGAADAGATVWMIIDRSAELPAIKGDYQRDEASRYGTCASCWRSSSRRGSTARSGSTSPATTSRIGTIPATTSTWHPTEWSRYSRTEPVANTPTWVGAEGSVPRTGSRIRRVNHGATDSA